MAGVLDGNSVCYHDQRSVRVFVGGPILALTSSKERVVELDIVTHSCDLRVGAVASTRRESNWHCVPFLALQLFIRIRHGSEYRVLPTIEA